jgi:hypothetical protein
MSDLTTRLHPVGTPVVGLILLSVLVVLIRSPSEGPEPANAAEEQALGGTTAESPSAADETPLVETSLADGCFRPGSSRAEVRALMGAPDTIDFGAWVYGESWVTFGYGVVLDYSNQGSNLKLC